MNVKKIVRRWMTHRLEAHGFEVRLKSSHQEFPSDFTASEIEMLRRVKPYSMVSNEGIVELRRAVQYLVENKIEGAIVECGVYRGGCMMSAALTLMEASDHQRNLYLFDTFSGMPGSSEKDSDHDGRTAETARPANGKWCYASREEVELNVRSTGYDMQRVHLVQGKVEETLPDQATEQIALLRLDTDFYESTYHELVHLYPRLVKRGVLIIDDYGYWRGCREAVDQYCREYQLASFLSRTTSSIRTMVKL